jgi:hypothetical protein
MAYQDDKSEGEDGSDTKRDAKALEQEGLDRRKEARNWKARFALDFKECYFFATPTRMRDVSSENAPAVGPDGDQNELQTSIGILNAQDFVTETVNTYMPESQPWCERGRGMFVKTEDWDKIADAVRKDDILIFDAMKASNLYSEVQKAFFPDLAIGTFGMWIHRPQVHGAISCQAVPLRELECNLGPDGEIDDRFVVRWTRNRYVRALLPGVQLPKAVADKLKSDPDERTCVWWGFWRLWNRLDDECWQAVVFVDKTMVDDKVHVGEGCCPLIVGRFNPCSDWPWGMGPLYTALPDLRQIDELEMQMIAHIELQLTPPITYPDDAFAAVEQGLEAGAAYPVRPGQQDAIKRIYEPGSPESGAYEHQDKEHRLRKLFYIDYPEQTGDTPPTLGQWLDEMARAQRRMGGPGAAFYREGPARIFLRFKYLLEAAGMLKPVRVNGKAVALLPYNPAQRAAEQQEIATNVQALQILSQVFPEEFKVQIDGDKTMRALIGKMRAKLIQFRDPEKVQAALGQITQLLKGRLGDAGGQGAGSPGTLPQVAP